MKILVAVKRVVDYNVKVHPLADGTDVDLSAAKMSMNPFDEIALEKAVQLKEAGLADEVIAFSLGVEKCADTLRQAMAIGADKAIHVVAESIIEPLGIAKILTSIAQRENVDLILLGKQAIDNDAAQVPQMVSSLLHCPVATNVSDLNIVENQLLVTRETDDGLMKLKGSMPAVISVDLRLAEPRYVTLSAMMKARKKPIETLKALDFGFDLTRKTKLLQVIEPPKKAGGVKLMSVDALLDQLKNKAKVL